MADKVIVKAEKRETRGKNEARRMRVAGNVPAIIYGGGGESVAVSASLADLAAVLRLDTGANTVFSLDIADDGVSDVMFQDRQIHPVTGRLIHADLRRLVKGEKIEMTLPVHLIGEAVGVKDEDGMLDQVIREVKVLVDPASAPESIDVDVSGLHVGEAIHISDLKAPKGVEIHGEGDEVVAHVVTVKEPELESQVEDGAEPAVAGDAAGSTEKSGE